MTGVVALAVECPPLEIHAPRGRDAEAVLAHRNSGHYLEAVPILLMGNGQADMDPLRTVRASATQETAIPHELPLALATQKTAILHELPLALAIQKTAILHEPPLALAIQKTAILHELPLALATQKTAILHELPLALAIQKTAIHHELPLALTTHPAIVRLNMTHVTLVEKLEILNMAPVTLLNMVPATILNMALAETNPHHPPHMTGSKVDRCVFPPSFENEWLAN